MALVRIPVLTSRASFRKTKKGNEYFMFSDKFVEVADKDDIEFFKGDNIYEVLDESDKKKVAEKKAEAKGNLVRPDYTKDELYALNKAQQVEIITKLGAEPGSFKTEADRVNFILESLGKR